jgi:hypothetical protein
MLAFAADHAILCTHSQLISLHDQRMTICCTVRRRPRTSQASLGARGSFYVVDPKFQGSLCDRGIDLQVSKKRRGAVDILYFANSDLSIGALKGVYHRRLRHGRHHQGSSARRC